jgi:predicted cupin superfamily sugar epimerase
MTAESIIKHLNLTRHPEGGFYSETYRAEKSVTLEDGKVRSAGTAIYYLLKGTDKSHFHRVGSDELWLFHQGEPLEIHVITKDGKIETRILGNRLDLNEVPQIAIPANAWFAACIKRGVGFSLVSCVVAPGFEFEDFELADKNEPRKCY